MKSDSDKSVSPGILLTYANSTTNPVVYAYRIAKIQQACSQIWRRFLMKINCSHGDKQAHWSKTGCWTNCTAMCQGSPNKGPQGHLKSEIFSQAHNLSITVSNNQLRIYYRKSTENRQAVNFKSLLELFGLNETSFLSAHNMCPPNPSSENFI